MLTAILIDGSFFLKRYRSIYGSSNSPKKVAQDLHDMCKKHTPASYYDTSELYRIFFYDCPPLDKKFQHPLTKKGIDFKKTTEYSFRMNLHQELKKLRKVALRLGRLSENGNWTIKSDKIKLLLNKTITLDSLNQEDIFMKHGKKVSI